MPDDHRHQEPEKEGDDEEADKEGHGGTTQNSGLPLTRFDISPLRIRPRYKFIDSLFLHLTLNPLGFRVGDACRIHAVHVQKDSNFSQIGSGRGQGVGQRGAVCFRLLLVKQTVGLNNVVVLSPAYRGDSCRRRGVEPVRMAI